MYLRCESICMAKLCPLAKIGEVPRTKSFETNNWQKSASGYIVGSEGTVQSLTVSKFSSVKW
jgi:hypothetical protein